MSSPTSTDPTMDAITAAVTTGRDGDTESARRRLLELWGEIGVLGDPLHRCTLAHYAADLYPDPAQALAWDIRAPDAADAATEERAEQYHPSLHIAGFCSLLHLNLADNYRRLGSFDAAEEHIAATRERISELPEGPYGDTIRTVLDELAEAITRGDATERDTTPGASSDRRRRPVWPREVVQPMMRFSTLETWGCLGCPTMARSSTKPRSPPCTRPYNRLAPVTSFAEEVRTTASVDSSHEFCLLALP